MTASLKSIVVKSLLFVALCGGFVAGARTTLNAQRSVVIQEDDPTAAQKVRDEFVLVLRKYPPAVAQVLKLDPSLMSTDQYLAPYPAITAFLNQHPEVRRSPAFYLEPVRASEGGGYYEDPRDRAWRDTTEMVSIFVVMLTVTSFFVWLIRTAVDYRRWGRLAKVQAEAHTKLLDRFTGNDELLAYVQSPAGSRFLKSSPISLDGTAKTMAAPLTRILWSMQAGVVMASAGLGLNYVSRHIDPYRADSVFLFSALALSVGLGFIVSAAASYIMSKRLGLLGDRPEPEESSS